MDTSVRYVSTNCRCKKAGIRVSFQHQPWTFMQFHVASGCMCLDTPRHLVARKRCLCASWPRNHHHCKGFPVISTALRQWYFANLRPFEHTKDPQTAKSRSKYSREWPVSIIFFLSFVWKSLDHYLCCVRCLHVFYKSGCHSSLSSMVMPTSATWSLTERMQSWFTMPLLGCQMLLVIPHHRSMIFQVAIQLVEVQGLRTERIRLVGELRVKVDASICKFILGGSHCGC